MSPRNADSREGSSTRGRLSRTAVILAAGVSCAVVAAAVLGYFSAPVVAGVLGAVAVIAIISFRHSAPQAPAHVFSSLDRSQHAAVIAAPRAAEVVGTPISSSDVA